MAAKKENEFVEYKNILDYVYEYGDKLFDELEFNDVDNAIFSAIAYFPFEEFEYSKRDEAKTINEFMIDFLSTRRVDKREKDGYIPWQINPIRLAMAVLSTKRYSKIKIIKYGFSFDEKKDTQFGALSFLLPDGTLAVAFRGTDNSVLGWKEDFLLCCRFKTNSQNLASKFLTSTIEMYPRKKFRVMGHSKGGNLAVYSCGTIDKKHLKHLIACYSNDGPGFLYPPVNYDLIKPKIIQIVPKECIIGKLLKKNKATYIVDAVPEGDIMFQHDIFNWMTDGTSFKKISSNSPFSKYISKSLSNFAVNSLTIDERENFINSLFNAIAQTGTNDPYKAFQDKGFFLKFVRFVMFSSDVKNKAVLISSFKAMIKSFTDNYKSYSDEMKKIRLKEEQDRKEEVKKLKEEKKEKNMKGQLVWKTQKI